MTNKLTNTNNLFIKFIKRFSFMMSVLVSVSALLFGAFKFADYLAGHIVSGVFILFVFVSAVHSLWWAIFEEMEDNEV